MYVYVSKILPLFVMPLGLALVLLLVALLFLRRGWKKTASGLLTVTALGLWLASTPFVAQELYRSLERQHPPVSLAEVPATDCIVLLGGAVGPALPPRTDIEMGEAVDRVYKTAQLYRAGKAPRIIVTAGNQPWSESPWVEAELLRDLLIQWGVSREAIFLEGSGRNTRENALHSKHLVDSMHCGTALLVTSAAHMPRAVMAFRGVGVDVVPVSTDVRVAGGGKLGAVTWLPDAEALAMPTAALREWLGQRVYAWQGWD
jgi:uncharacterized SAM-binding protein YcdF (DUF218 family)